MSYIKNHRAILGDLFHHTKPKHINYKIVISKTSSAITYYQLFISCLDKLLYDIQNLIWTEELRLLYVNHFISSCQRNNKVSLSRKKRRKLHYICHLCDYWSLPWLMHISKDWYIKIIFNSLQDSHPLLQARASIRVNGGSISLIKATLKDIRDSQLLRNPDKFMRRLQCQIL